MTGEDDKTVYVIGHKNPDLDSICSAIAYAEFKNITDRKRHYVAARCGHLNNQSASYLQAFSIPKPVYMSDSFIHVGDVLTRTDTVLYHSDPLYRLVSVFEDEKYDYSVIPVFKDAKYRTLLTKESIASYFLKMSDAKKREEICFDTSFWQEGVGGHFLKKGDKTEFKASMMIGCMERGEVVRRIRALRRNGRKIVFITGNRIDAINSAIREKVDAVVITGISPEQEQKVRSDGYAGTIFVSGTDTSQTIRHLRMCQKVSLLHDEDFPSITESALYEEAKSMLLSKGLKALAVTDNDGKFTGFVTRRNFLFKPKRSFILVDHNERSQCIDGIEEADIREIVDHHRFNSEKTTMPIFINAEPIGSTCSIVWELFKRRHVRISKQIATVLLGGLVSDTVFLKSPTATAIDRKAYQDLLAISGLDEKRLSDVIYSNCGKMDDLDSDKAVSSDFKIYSEGGQKFGVGQVEIVGMPEVKGNAKIGELLVSLERMKDFQFLSFAMLMVSDAQTASSLLLSTKTSVTDNLQFKEIVPGVFDMPGVISRKKQLLPELLRALAE